MDFYAYKIQNREVDAIYHIASIENIIDTYMGHECIIIVCNNKESTQSNIELFLTDVADFGYSVYKFEGIKQGARIQIRGTEFYFIDNTVRKNWYHSGEENKIIYIWQSLDNAITKLINNLIHIKPASRMYGGLGFNIIIKEHSNHEKTSKAAIYNETIDNLNHYMKQINQRLAIKSFDHFRTNYEAGKRDNI